jgi:LuxR family maltose regulon positive regulatory protein
MALRPQRDIHAAGGAIPKLPALLVRRPRLERSFDEDQRSPVTLVTSVPGGGKTTLLASWARATAVPVAWRTVGEGDNRRGCLARAVVWSLADAGVVSRELVGSGDHYQDGVHAAFAEIEARDRRAMLVLDDVDVVATRASIGVLDELAWRSPPLLDVVLASRADPPLRLGRLRLDGRLGELRNADLSFRPAETAALFEAAGLRLRHHDLAEIHARTEGWAAGVRLVASAIERGAAPERLASEPGTAVAAVADYLVEEVLGREPADVQQFLLRTSVAQMLTAELAVGLSERPEAGAWLGDLQRRGLFLSELEGGEWYRYHSLFGALLRARLRRQDPALWRSLHARTARWYAERELAHEAEKHARRAEDWSFLGTLVQRRWLDSTVEGVLTTPGLLDGVTQSVMREHSALALVATAVALETGDLAGADAMYARLPPPAVDPSDASREVLELVRSRACGASDQARSTAATLVRKGGSPSPDARLRRWASLRSAELDLDEGALDRARTTLAALADDDRSPVGTEAAGLLALVQAVDGRLAPAASLAGEVLGAPDPESGPVAVVSARLALVLCEAQSGKPVAAAAALAGIDASATAPSRILRVVLRAVYAAQDGGTPLVVGLDTTAARHPLASLALIALGVLELVDAAGARLLLGGSAEAAVRELRYALAARDALGPTEIRPATPPLPAGGHVRTQVELQVLAALAASATPAAARRHIQDALNLAEASQVRAPLVLHGHRLEPVLQAMAAEHGSLQRPALDLLDAGSGCQAPAFIEPLTAQELVVLGFLPTLMSNREIASAMHLSVNTVKTHVKAVYRKLGVERRRTAVVRARQLELL